MKVLEGYWKYLDFGDDINLKKCKEKKGVFYIFSSLEAWKKEMSRKDMTHDIPTKKLIQGEYQRNRFIAPP